MPTQVSAADAPEDPWRCAECGWTYPNHHPSAKHRRDHRKQCGKLAGFHSTAAISSRPSSLAQAGGAGTGEENRDLPSQPVPNTNKCHEQNMPEVCPAVAAFGEDSRPTPEMNARGIDGPDQRGGETNLGVETASSVKRLDLSSAGETPTANCQRCVSGRWVCRQCGWAHSNARPSAKHRRKHKQKCGEAVAPASIDEILADDVSTEGDRRHQNAQLSDDRSTAFASDSRNSTGFDEERQRGTQTDEPSPVIAEGDHSGVASRAAGVEQALLEKSDSEALNEPPASGESLTMGRPQSTAIAGQQQQHRSKFPVSICLAGPSTLDAGKGAPPPETRSHTLGSPARDNHEPFVYEARSHIHSKKGTRKHTTNHDTAGEAEAITEARAFMNSRREAKQHPPEKNNAPVPRPAAQAQKEAGPERAAGEAQNGGSGAQNGCSNGGAAPNAGGQESRDGDDSCQWKLRSMKSLIKEVSDPKVPLRLDSSEPPTFLVAEALKDHAACQQDVKKATNSHASHMRVVDSDGTFLESGENMQRALESSDSRGPLVAVKSKSASSVAAAENRKQDEMGPSEGPQHGAVHTVGQEAVHGKENRERRTLDSGGSKKLSSGEWQLKSMKSLLQDSSITQLLVLGELDGKTGEDILAQPAAVSAQPSVAPLPDPDGPHHSAAQEVNGVTIGTSSPSDGVTHKEILPEKKADPREPQIDEDGSIRLPEEEGFGPMTQRPPAPDANSNPPAEDWIPVRPVLKSAQPKVVGRSCLQLDAIQTSSPASPEGLVRSRVQEFEKLAGLEAPLRAKSFSPSPKSFSPSPRSFSSSPKSSSPRASESTAHPGPYASVDRACDISTDGAVRKAKENLQGTLANLRHQQSNDRPNPLADRKLPPEMFHVMSHLRHRDGIHEPVGNIA